MAKTSKTAPEPRLNLSFEAALSELEEITQLLEDGKESLEKSMELYERGVLLKQLCEKKLSEAEGKWTVLKKGPGGEIEEQIIAQEKEQEDSPNGSSPDTQGSMF